MRIVLLTKTDRFSRAAQLYAANHWPDLEIAEGAVGDTRPDCLAIHGDLLISFLSPWIVRADELDRFKAAVNFHPASTDYPGSGCYNFALYEGAREYGATCHHMLPQVDTGTVIMERRFPVGPRATVERLKLRTMETMLAMFREIADLLASGESLPKSEARWTRKPFTRAQMDALKVVLPTMPEREVRRRVRASTYPGYPGAYMVQSDGVYPFPVPKRAPLA